MKQKKHQTEFPGMQKRLLTGFMASLPGIAFADSGDAANTILQNLIQWLTGNIAQSFVILFVIYSGLSFLTGRMDKQKMVVQLIGAGLIFGAQYYAHNVFLKGVMS